MRVLKEQAFLQRCLRLFIVISVASLTTACPTEEAGPNANATRTLQSPDLTWGSIDPLTEADVIALVPPRTGWNPGLIFEGSVDGDKINAERVVCRNLFGDAAPEPDYIIIQTGETRKDRNFSVGADLAADLIPGVDIKADLAKIEASNFVKIEAERAALLHYTLEEQLTLQPSLTCLRAIDLLKQRGRFQERVFIIPAVFAVQGLRYEISDTAAAGGELGASVAKILDAAIKAGYQRSSSGSGTTIASHEGWITLRTARPVFIKDWDVSGAIGAGREVAITLETVPGDVAAVEVDDNF
jgi:hypothetical protein